MVVDKSSFYRCILVNKCRRNDRIWTLLSEVYWNNVFGKWSSIDIKTIKWKAGTIPISQINFNITKSKTTRH